MKLEKTEKKESNTRKRSFYEVTVRNHEQVKTLSESKNKSMIAYIDELCNRIVDGEYDDLAKEFEKDNWKNIGIYQDSRKKVEKALEGKRINVLSFLKVVIEKEFNELGL